MTSVPPSRPAGWNPIWTIQTVASAIVIGLMVWVGTGVNQLQRDVAVLKEQYRFINERELEHIQQRINQHDDRFKNFSARIRVLEGRVLTPGENP